jgi:hypothetical protein
MKPMTAGMSMRMMEMTMLFVSLFIAGCKSRSTPVAASEPPPITPEIVENTTAQSAAMLSLPSVADARIGQEILLHAALYRAAYQSNVGDFTSHFVLQPVDEADPIDLGVEPDEFRLRVLAELADLGAPIAWRSESWQEHPIDLFPGSHEVATRLQIKIIQRIEDQATVIGEVGDQTAGVGSSRQGVTATWDGKRWNIERDRVRLVW